MNPPGEGGCGTFQLLVEGGTTVVASIRRNMSQA